MLSRDEVRRKKSKGISEGVSMARLKYDYERRLLGSRSKAFQQVKVK